VAGFGLTKTLKGLHVSYLQDFDTAAQRPDLVSDLREIHADGRFQFGE
jgi:hypothetical protein